MRPSKFHTFVYPTLSKTLALILPHRSWAANIAYRGSVSHSVAYGRAAFHGDRASHLRMHRFRATARVPESPRQCEGFAAL